MAGRKRIVAIVGNQRSGTTAIGRLAGSQDGARHVGEIFHAIRGPQDDPHFEKYLTDPEANFFAFKQRLLTGDPTLIYPSLGNQEALWKAYLDHLFALGPERTWVIDVKYNSFHHLNAVWQNPLHRPLLMSFFVRAEVPILHVVRRDLFAQAVSSLLAQRTRRWHVKTDTPDTASPPAIVVDPRKLAAAMHANAALIQRYEQWLKEYRPSNLLEYETAFRDGDLTADARNVIGDLFGFGQPLEGEPDLKKRAPDDLRSVVANPEEVLLHFRGSRFEALAASHLDRAY